MKEKLINVYNALNTVEVKGRNNCAIISGVMATIEEIIMEIDSKKGDDVSCDK